MCVELFYDDPLLISLQGIVTRITLKVFPQTQVWVCVRRSIYLIF